MILGQGQSSAGSAGGGGSLTPALIALVVAILGGFLAYVLYEYFHSRIVVRKFGKRTSGKYRTSFASLFADLIAVDQQLDTDVICERCLNRRGYFEVKWAKLRKQDPTRTEPEALLLLATHAQQLVGFINVIFGATVRYLLIAYLSVDSAPGLQAGAVTDALLRKLAREAKSRGGQYRVVFEISPPVDQSDASKSRFRLFRNYAKRFGYCAAIPPFPYLQLDLDAATLEGKTEAAADLCYATSGDSPTDIGPDDFLELVKAIYEEVYSQSFPNDTDGAYRSYADTAYALIEEQVRSGMRP